MAANEQKQDPPKERIGYGVKVPYLSFEESVKITKEVCRLSGFDGSIDVLSKVTGNSTSSSSFVFKVRVLKGYGLLTVQDNSYSLTDIGKRVAKAESPQDEVQAIFEAFCKHDTLSKVWENYKGKILPQSEYLANHFETNYGIPANLKESWAQYFVEAAKYAGLLDTRESGSYQVRLQPTVEKKADIEHPTNGKSSTESPTRRPETHVESLTKNPSLPAIEVTEGEHWGILSQRRISGNRKAVIAIPDELLPEDIEMLKVILKGIDMQLDGLKKSEA